MIKENIVMHLANDFIYIKTKHGIIEEKSIYIDKDGNKHNIIKNGKLNSYKYAQKLLSSIVKKHKLNNALFNNDISIVINSFYSPLEIRALKDIFKNLSFNKIRIHKEQKLFNKANDNQKIVLNIATTYIEYFHYDDNLKKKLRIVSNSFVTEKEYIKTLVNQISLLIDNYNGTKLLILAFGSKKNITKISKILEQKLKINITFLENKSYLMNYL